MQIQKAVSAMQLTLQKANQFDVPDIIRLTDAAYEKYISRIGRKPQPTTADYAAMLETHDIWLMRQDHEIIGLLVLQKEDETLFIYSIAVSVDQQGKRIGKQLLMWTEQHALEIGCQRVRLYTNEKMTENIAIYTHLGYTETQREKINDFYVVHMAKELHHGKNIV
jgi:ribosomal protein S18 acetylase RimI-like enzyme